MSHDINVTNGKASIAYVGANGAPWHGLGQPLTAGATLEQWRAEAGMLFDIERKPLTYIHNGAEYQYPGRVALIRSDTGAPLSVVSDRYEVVQTRQVIEFFRDLTEAYGFTLETAGVLGDGAKYWALARNGHSVTFGKGDKVDSYLLLATSCDGTMRTLAKFTSIRVVCQNTLGMARSERGGVSVSVSHRSAFDASKIKQTLGIMDNAWDEHANNLQRLIETEIDREWAKKMVSDLFARSAKVSEEPARVEVAGVSDMERLMGGAALIGGKLPKAPKAPRVLEPILQKWDGAGMGAEGYQGTAYGLLQAVTEYVDHDASRTADTRLTSAWFGRGEAVKDECFAQLLTKACAQR